MDRPWTPGPWAIVDSNEVHDSSGRRIAIVRWLHGMPVEQFAANKRLIAAAPELYEALETMVRAFLVHTQWCRTPAEVRAASALLARIEGREP